MKHIKTLSLAIFIAMSLLIIAHAFLLTIAIDTSFADAMGKAIGGLFNAN